MTTQGREMLGRPQPLYFVQALGVGKELHGCHFRLRPCFLGSEHPWGVPALLEPYGGPNLEEAEGDDFCLLISGMD